MRDVIDMFTQWYMGWYENRCRRERRCIICGNKFAKDLYSKKWTACDFHADELDSISEEYNCIKKQL